MKKREIECGCEILIYEDGSAAPEVVYCRLHASAETMSTALAEIRQTVEARACEHACKGIHCSRCGPAEVAEIARKALEIAGIKE
jgi:hypothetical protein